MNERERETDGRESKRRRVLREKKDILRERGGCVGLCVCVCLRERERERESERERKERERRRAVRENKDILREREMRDTKKREGG